MSSLYDQRPSLAGNRHISLRPFTEETFSHLSETAKRYCTYNVWRRWQSIQEDREHAKYVQQHQDWGVRATGTQPPLPYVPPRQISQPLPVIRQTPDVTEEKTVQLPALRTTNPSLPVVREQHTSATIDLRHIISLPKHITDAINPSNLPRAIVLHPRTAHTLSAIGKLQEGHFVYYSVLIEVITSDSIPLNDYHLIESSLELLKYIS